MTPILFTNSVPFEPSPILLAVLITLAMLSKLSRYRQTRETQKLAEAGARLALAIFYGLVAAASWSDFGSIFTQDLWRIYARWGLMALFLVEIIPWLVSILKGWMKR